MADSLKDIFANRYNDVPPEITAIKEYVQQQFKSDVSVMLRDKQIVIVTQSAALAATLRLHTPHLQKAANTKLRLQIRIT